MTLSEDEARRRTAAGIVCISHFRGKGSELCSIPTLNSRYMDITEMLRCYIIIMGLESGFDKETRHLYVYENKTVLILAPSTSKKFKLTGSLLEVKLSSHHVSHVSHHQ